VDALNAADWVIVTVVGSSMLISLLRGFVREAFSLAGWVLGFIVAMVFSDRLAYLPGGFVNDETGRYILAFALLFVLTLIAVALAGKLLLSLVQFAGLGMLDRVLGMAFGFARGVVILLAVVMLRELLELDSFEWWQSSVLLPHLLLLESGFRQFTGTLSALLAGAVN